MAAYGNVHIALEQMRVRALSKIRGSPLPPGQDNVDPKLTEPPRVLILGPENAGKTTVAKILANYTVRAGQGWSPLLANVDPSEVSCMLCHTCYSHPQLAWKSRREAGRSPVQYLSPP